MSLRKWGTQGYTEREREREMLMRKSLHVYMLLPIVQLLIGKEMISNHETQAGCYFFCLIKQQKVLVGMQNMLRHASCFMVRNNLHSFPQTAPCLLRGLFSRLQWQQRPACDEMSVFAWSSFNYECVRDAAKDHWCDRYQKVNHAGLFLFFPKYCKLIWGISVTLFWIGRWLEKV